MRLKKENIIIKNKKKALGKDKNMTEGNQNLKKKYESVYLQSKVDKLTVNQMKEKLKEKIIKENNIYNNPIISKHLKRSQPKQINQFKKVIDKKNITPNNNKPITMNTNNNINIGNNINIITNNNDTNMKNNIIKNNMINNSKLVSDYDIKKKHISDLYDDSTNTIYSINYNRINKVNNEDTKFKRKNASTEQRYRGINKDIYINDDSAYDEDKIEQLTNHINIRNYKRFSAGDNYNINKIYNNRYINSNDERNWDENKRISYNNNYNNISNNNNYFKIHPNNYILNEDYNISGNNTINNNDFQSKTLNNFSTLRNPLTLIRSINRNYNNNYLNYINNKNRIGLGNFNSMILEENKKKSPFDNFNESYLEFRNSFRNEGYKTSRRSKNKVRITKIDNPDVIEYNLDIPDDNYDTTDFPKEFNIRKKLDINNRYNNYKYDNNFTDQKDLQKYYNYFTKNIKPISNNHFNIYGCPPNIITKSNYRYLNSPKYISRINNFETIYSPYISEINKSPKKMNINKIKPLNISDFIGNNNIINKSINLNLNEGNYTNRILIKKRPINEIHEIQEIGSQSNSIKRRNSISNVNINKTNYYKNNINKYEICKNDNIYFNSIKRNNENKLCFNNEIEVIDFINKKYEEEKKEKKNFNKDMKYTGFILCKKYKGENLFDIRIEDDIDKINNKLKEEKVLINDKQVELKYFDNDKKINNEENKNEFNEEIKKLKLENEKLNKKDNFKSELITKLDKEKQKLVEEIEILTKKIEELQNINNKLVEENNNYIKNTNKNGLNKNIPFEIEYNSLNIIVNEKNNKIIEISTLKIDEENKLINSNDFINKLNNDFLIDDYKNKNEENENQNNNSFNNNQMLSDIINSENLDEKIYDINIENYCNNNNYSIDNNLNEINHNKNDFIDISDNEEIVKIDQNNNNINLEENKEINNNNIIKENSNNDLNNSNQSDKKVNNLSESLVNEKEG